MTTERGINMCATTNRPDTKSNSNHILTTYLLACSSKHSTRISNMSYEATNPEKLIQVGVIAPFLPLPVVIATL